MLHRQPEWLYCVLPAHAKKKVFAPPTAARITAPGPIFRAQIVLSIPPSPRISAATQPE